MSFFQNPSFYIQTAESDIVNFFTKAESEAQILEQDFLNVLGWVQSNASEIAGLIAGLLGVVVGVSGGSIPAAVLSAQTALTQAVQLLNAAIAAAQAQQAGGGSVTAQTVAAVAAAYAQLKAAQAAAATVAGSAAAPAPTPAAA